MANNDSAFLGELLALIDGADAAAWTATELPTTDEASSVSVPRDAPLARQRRPPTSGAAGLKRSIEATRTEASELSTQLVQLRKHHGSGAKETALSERRKRQRAEAECLELRRAVYAQSQFLRGLSSVFSATPQLSVNLDMCRYLHRHTRLPRHERSRWSDFTLQDDRLRAAMDMLCHETASMTLTDTPREDARVHGEQVDDVDSRSTTSMAVYTVDTTDIHAVVRAVCVAIRDVVTICPSGHPLRVSRDVVDMDVSAAGNVLYRVMDVSHCCPETGDELTIESHVVTSYKLYDDYAVVMWDFVDADDLHPTPDATNVTREITGACLVRREWCDDGVERTVFRSLSTKKFRFRRGMLVEKLRKFVCIAHPVAMVRGNELLFRRIVLDELAAEKRAMETAVGQTNRMLTKF